MIFKKFETEMKVRPSEIDYNGHVHQSAYLDYLLFARVDQMQRCYKIPIEEFFKRGLSWATKSIAIDYQKSLYMNERFIVRTWIESFGEKSVDVRFQMLKASSGEVATEGTSTYVLIDAKTRKPTAIPEDIKDKFSV
ncbi:MAG: acyl-CoA thioesterase [Candidatus Aminicenantes bacterium]|jgi:acyl-CoA thioester hydrolase/thioesterase-3